MGDRIKNFKYLIWTSALSNMADGMLLASLPIVALKISNDPAFIANVIGAKDLPWIALSLLAGTIIDKYNNKNVLLVSNLSRAITVFLLFIVSYQSSAVLPLLMLLSFLTGSFEVLGDTCSACIPPKIIKNKNDLEKANSSLQTIERFFNCVAGGIVTSIVSYFFSIKYTFLLISSLYFVAFLFSSKLQVPSSRATLSRKKTNKKESGFNIIFNNQELKTLTIMALINNFSFYGISATLIIFCTEKLDTPKEFIGITLSALGAGMVLGAFISMKVLSRYEKTKSFVVSSAFIPILLLINPIFLNKYILLISFFILGGLYSFCRVISVSYRQKSAGNKIGAVTSVSRFFSWGAQPIAAFLGGWLTLKFGVTNSFIIFSFCNFLNFYWLFKMNESFFNFNSSNIEKESLSFNQS